VDYSISCHQLNRSKIEHDSSLLQNTNILPHLNFAIFLCGSLLRIFQLILLSNLSYFFCKTYMCYLLNYFSGKSSNCVRCWRGICWRKK